jgi:hypothetical protein
MAGLTFNIGGVPFTALTYSAGRKALDIRVDAPSYDLKRFHPPGPDGNFIIRCGRHGGKITALFRYIDILDTALDNFNADKTAWRNTAVAIIDDEGSTYPRCNLENMTRIVSPRGISRAGNSFAYFDVMATFTWDG